MDLGEAIIARHSVRAYTDQPLEGEILAEMQRVIDGCNSEGGLHMQLCLNEPRAFSGLMARYGKFSNVKNYIAIIGRKTADFEEKAGYYGEKAVLEAQRLGLNTCWVGGTFSRNKAAVTVAEGERYLMVISIGYGVSNGAFHKRKDAAELYTAPPEPPQWFLAGMEAVRLAPTAMNQQKFHFTLEGNVVKAEAGGGFFTKVDLGIAKYHFEAGAHKGGWTWG
jgi:nitroreductase